LVGVLLRGVGRLLGWSFGRGFGWSFGRGFGWSFGWSMVGVVSVRVFAGNIR
jgi:hypothetical protein